jgi:type I restriction enzyme, S subunit
MKKYVQLGDIAKIYSGGTPSRTKKTYWGGKIPWVKTAQIQNCLIDETDVDEWITEEGLVDSLTYFNKQVFSLDTSTYKVVTRGQFAYATNHIEEGSIGYQDVYDKGLVSPMYTVFETNKDMDDSYLYKVFKSVVYLHIFRANTSSSVDRRGSLRWKEFAKLPIPLPPIEEQKQIAAILTTARQEIDLLKKQAEAYRRQKRGLMQRLLTGEWRVRVG